MEDSPEETGFVLMTAEAHLPAEEHSLLPLTVAIPVEERALLPVAISP